MTTPWPHEEDGALNYFYGDPRGHGDKPNPEWVHLHIGRVVPPWKMTEEGRPVEYIEIHDRCVEPLRRIFDKIWNHYGRSQLAIEAHNLDKFDGSFVFRRNRNDPTKLSMHARAAALDLAADKNPNGKPWEPNAGMMPIDVVKIFAEEGWSWGGQFHGTKDCMHFQATHNIHADEKLPRDPASIADPPTPDAKAEPTPTTTAPPAAPDPELVAGMVQAGAAAIARASSSPLVHVRWRGRGVAPLGYIKGMAACFAISLWRLVRGDGPATEMAKPVKGDTAHDALAWYESKGMFAAADIDVGDQPPDILRALFVLMIGHGMRESSGQYFVGRDRKAHNVTADTAEAGLFQMSWNAHPASPKIKTLFDTYALGHGGNALLDVFKEGVTPNARDLQNYGSGDGATFQMLCKTKPQFAVEAAAVGLRNRRSHWGPINQREAELSIDAEHLLADIQKEVLK